MRIHNTTLSLPTMVNTPFARSDIEILTNANFTNLTTCWHRIIDITSFEKHFLSSLDHTPNFCRNLAILRSKNIRWSSLWTKEGQNSQTPSMTTVWPIDHREDYRSCALPFYSLVHTFHKALHSDKAVGTIWRALSKPTQRRQGPNRPSDYFVGTPSAIRPELASRRAEHSLSYSDVAIYIYLMYNIYYLCRLCIEFYDLSA